MTTPIIELHELLLRQVASALQEQNPRIASCGLVLCSNPVHLLYWVNSDRLYYCCGYNGGVVSGYLLLSDPQLLQPEYLLRPLLRAMMQHPTIAELVDWSIHYGDYSIAMDRRYLIAFHTPTGARMRVLIKLTRSGRSDTH